MTATTLRTEACRSCRAPIVWVTHVLTGKPAPLDAAVDLNGNCVLYDNGTYAVLRKTDTIAAPGADAYQPLPDLQRREEMEPQMSHPAPDDRAAAIAWAQSVGSWTTVCYDNMMPGDNSGAEPREMEECSACDGTGKDGDGTDCEWCDGTGLAGPDPDDYDEPWPTEGRI